MHPSAESNTYSIWLQFPHKFEIPEFSRMLSKTSLGNAIKKRTRRQHLREEALILRTWGTCREQICKIRPVLDRKQHRDEYFTVEVSLIISGFRKKKENMTKSIGKTIKLS